MKTILEEDFKKYLKEKIGTPIRVCFNNEEREPLYLFIDEKEQDCILKQAIKDCVTHFLKEQLIPYKDIRIEPQPFSLNKKKK